MRVWMAAPCALAMLVCSACGVMVADGVGGGGGGGSTSTVTTTTTGTGMVVPPNAVAFRNGDVPGGPIADLNDPESPDADALVLFFSNLPLSCSDPAPTISDSPPPCEASDTWWLGMAIPPDLAGGGLVDLQNTRIMEEASEAFDNCSGYGGRQTPGGTGTLDILGSGSSALSVKLTGGVKAMMEVVDGSYSATWCSKPPPAPTPAQSSSLRACRAATSNSGSHPN